jgi:glycogen debranching enzyme
MRPPEQQSAASADGVRPAAVHAREAGVDLYQASTVFRSDETGDVDGGRHGLFVRQTRVLSRWQLLIDGEALAPAGAGLVAANRWLGYFVAPRHAQQIAGMGEAQPALAVRVSREAGDGLHEDLTVENFTGRDVEFDLSWAIEADFADLAEAMEGVRRQCAPVEDTHRCRGDASELTVRYLHTGLARSVTIAGPASPDGPRWHDGRLTYHLRLANGATRAFCTRVRSSFEGEVVEPAYGCGGGVQGDGRGAARERRQRAAVAGASGITAPTAGVQEAWDSALRDLASLALFDATAEEDMTPMAGVPAYNALFGRDALTASFQSLMAQPDVLRATLVRLARMVGDGYEDFFDLEPGRIVHQAERGPLATLRKNAFLHYYGDYAGPPAFLFALAQYYFWTGDGDLVRRLYPAAERVRKWIDTRADLDRDGFVEYRTRSPVGTKNQGWKDSGEAILDADGRLFDIPLESCDVK